ncbi:MAG TPA: ATP-dependent DNA ligase [Acidimicrobiales bacterium]|nr:ATP-dependent DNA ligase [Acidimicrobiales bacterium]
MLLAELVRTSETVASTRARSAKVAALAGLLRRLAPEEVEPAVAFLAGEPRQGKVGVGWATLRAVEPPPGTEPSIAVLELDSALTALQSLTGPGSAAARHELLADLLGRATDAEAGFIRRLLIGELRQGALEGVMTEAVARASGVALAAVRRAVMLAGDLGRVAAVALSEGESGLSAVGLEVLNPVLPMLASTADDVASALSALGPSSVEWKLDGARLQAHRKGDEVRLYTRNLNEVTDRLPAVVAVIHDLSVDQVVLDGEVLGVTDEGPGPFQDTMSSFSRRSSSAGAEALGAWFFDCLHLDDEDLLDRPLADRSAALDRTGARRVPSLVTDDVDAALAFQAEALAAGHEGVMVKALSSLYEAGRRGGAWRKVKPVRTLDLLVIAAEWGTGRRRGWLSNLHLAARDESGGHVMVGKTFKGLTDAVLEWQTAEFLSREAGREDHVVRIDPPLVVEVALDGVQTSTRYPGGVALRFARVRCYRDDKDPADADTIDAVRALLPGPGTGTAKASLPSIEFPWR